MNNYTSFATDLAYKAGDIMRKNFSLGMKKEPNKKDTSPVTASDIAINHLVINAIGKRFPQHSIIGEEESNKKEGEYVWFCDPIDGTIPFSSGIPVAAFSLALTKNGVPIVGVIYDPFMDRLFVGEKGKGAFLNKKKITVSQDMSLTTRALYMGWWKHSVYDLGLFRAELSKKGVKMMDFCSFVYAGAFVAAGEFNAIIYGDNFPWDVAAVQILVQEAGGQCTDFAGKEPNYKSEINGFIASNGDIHDELLTLVKQFAIKN